MLIVKKIDYKPPEGAMMKDGSKVETEAFYPTNRMIEDLIYAGRRLKQSREEQYDFVDDRISFNIPAGRDVAFDRLDAEQAIVEGRRAAERVNKAVQEEKRKKIKEKEDSERQTESKEGNKEPEKDSK